MHDVRQPSCSIEAHRTFNALKDLPRFKAGQYHNFSPRAANILALQAA
jgi:hypothetical protein